MMKRTTPTNPRVQLLSETYPNPSDTQSISDGRDDADACTGCVETALAVTADVNPDTDVETVGFTYDVVEGIDDIAAVV